METTSSTGVVSPSRVDRAESAVDAYKRVEPAILALPLDDVGRVTADPVHASSIALGALSNLQQLRPEFEKISDGGVAIRALDGLEDYALASFFSQLQASAEVSQKELMALLERARPVRENLLKVAEALVGFDIFPEKAVSSIREGAGHLDLAKDLVALSTLFTSNWSLVENNVPFGPELVEEASSIGPQLLRAVGSKEVGEVRKDPSFDWPALRDRAFRLLVNCYEDLRRATAYVRWFEGDAKDFTPTLHSRAMPRRKSNKTDADELPEAEQPESEQVLLGANVPQAEPGMPGANPFSA